MTELISPEKSTPPVGHEWEEAGTAWGHRSRDWACLFEHYAIDVIQAVFSRLAVGEDSVLLDVACGSGLAVRYADAMGATTAGIDASESLIALARERTPRADLRIGTMFALPWADETFDSVISINGIWGGCEGALEEAFRVLQPGGRIGISFWGNGKPLDLRPTFFAFAANSPASHLEGMRRTNNIARPASRGDDARVSGLRSRRTGHAGVNARVAGRGHRVAGPVERRTGRSRAGPRGPRSAPARRARRGRAVSGHIRHLPVSQRPPVRDRPQSRCPSWGASVMNVHDALAAWGTFDQDHPFPLFDDDPSAGACARGNSRRRARCLVDHRSCRSASRAQRSAHLEGYARSSRVAQATSWPRASPGPRSRGTCSRSIRPITPGCADSSRAHSRSAESRGSKVMCARS